MLNIQRFVFNFIEVNCYLLWDETGEAVVIDCGAFSENERQEITSFIEENNLTLRHQLYTHGHFDHIFGAQHMADTYGILPTLHRDEADTYRAAAQQMQAFLHRNLPLSIPPVGTLLSDGEIIKFGTHTLRVISTPGHTAGGVCYYCAEENVLLRQLVPWLDWPLRLARWQRSHPHLRFATTNFGVALRNTSTPRTRRCHYH